MTDVSITDIARAAGVSPSTVSRALQGNQRISSERRAAIRELARSMGYRPCLAARGLVTGRTGSIGVVVSDVTDPFVAEVLKGAEAASREADYSLLFAMSHRCPDREIAAAEALADRQVDAMIFISSRAGERYVELLHRGRRGLPVPLVLVNNDRAGPNIYGVRTDNRAGARALVSYLFDLGHRRIAFVAGPEGGRSSRERLEGYQQGLEVHGLRVAADLLVHGSGQLDDGLRALSKLMALQQRPSAVVCYNDMSAIGMLGGAAVMGIRVPVDLSVVGYDNIPMSACTVPGLTTMDQPKEAMGRRAVQVCLQALAGDSIEDTVLPGTLVLRASAAPFGEPTRMMLTRSDIVQEGEHLP